MKKIFLNLLFLIFYFDNAKSLENCKWDNREGVPCITVSKTNNTSKINEKSINKKTISKKIIEDSNASDIVDVLKNINGLDVFQSGNKGQTTSIFSRGSESNHTLVLLNGVPINDQSTTDGLHDFGQDFVQTFEQIDIYKGANGAHFGPNAIAGAINFLTDIDYVNNISTSIAPLINFSKNNSFKINLTEILSNDWHLNLKGSTTSIETNSSIANGNEDDGAKNYQLNFNGTKWISDDLKFNSTFFLRKTKADYDNSSTDESGFVSNNKMHALQTSLNQKMKNKENNFIFHYHRYDREYDNSGYLDEYESESLFFRADNRSNFSRNFSYGFGSEYKYDWGAFENRGSYNASTKGHMDSLGLFSNIGYKNRLNQIYSIYLRSDKHNTTGHNETFKLNFTQNLSNFIIGTTLSTGLRNPSLYELYGSDNYGLKGNINLKPEKSKTNEIYFEYDFSENLKFSSTGYKSKVFDRIETNSLYTKHENINTDIKQEGLENEIQFKTYNKQILLFSHFSKSIKDNGQSQSRRPNLSYGLNYSHKKESKLIGKYNLNFNYKHTGPYIDWDGNFNSKQKKTNLVDLSINKFWFDNLFSIKIENFLNERYQKPATYSQDGRMLIIRYSKNFNFY